MLNLKVPLNIFRKSEIFQRKTHANQSIKSNTTQYLLSIKISRKNLQEEMIHQNSKKRTFKNLITHFILIHFCRIFYFYFFA